MNKMERCWQIYLRLDNFFGKKERKIKIFDKSNDRGKYFSRLQFRKRKMQILFEKLQKL